MRPDNVTRYLDQFPPLLAGQTRGHLGSPELPEPVREDLEKEVRQVALGLYALRDQHWRVRAVRIVLGQIDERLPAVSPVEMRGYVDGMAMLLGSGIFSEALRRTLTADRERQILAIKERSGT